jgi:hypothetical protein
MMLKDLAWAWKEGPQTTTPWRPLLKAVRAGALLFWVTRETAHVLPVPKIHRIHQRAVGVWREEIEILHREDGPVVEWPDGSGLYFWEDVEVPAEMVTNPESLRASDIVNQGNIELRRTMIERKGLGRFLREAGAKKRDQNEWGTLYELRLPREGLLVVLEVTCPSTRRHYLLRVPPWVRSAKQAVAWTFNCRPKEYKPTAQT